MFDAIISLLSGAGGMLAGGGIVGLLGNVGLAWVKGKQAEKRNAYELAMREEDRKDMRIESELAIQRVSIESDYSIKEAQIEADSRAAADSYKGMTEAIHADNAAYLDDAEGMPAAIQYMMAGVDTIRGLTRPFLTWFLVYQSAMMIYAAKIDAGIWHAMTGTAVGFWFGERFLNKK